MRMSKEEFMKGFASERPQSRIGGGTMPKANKKPRTDWTPELVEELKKAYSENLPELEIAERLGVDEVAVKNKITRLGLRKLKAVSESADAIYIKQLEDLLKERTEKLEHIKQELKASTVLNRQLTEEFESVKWELSAAKSAREQAEKDLVIFKEKAASALTDSPNLGAMEEIYAIADCLGAINLNDLMDSKSAQYLICKILDVASDALINDGMDKGMINNGNDTVGNLPGLHTGTEQVRAG